MQRMLLLVALLFSVAVNADSHSSDEMAPPSIPTLPAMGAMPDQTSISGLSSGGFMAAQFHVAYSEDLVGVGIVAGGPWNCAASLPTNPFMPPINVAVSTCMNPCKYSWVGCPSILFPDSSYLVKLAGEEADLGNIDALSNLQDDKVYIFSGSKDETVITRVVDRTDEFYRLLGIDKAAIRYNHSVDAGHAFITANPDDTECPITEAPYINNCGIHQSERILSHIYGDLKPAVAAVAENLLEFDQQAFIDSNISSMDETAYVYIPDACKNGDCKVHVAVHGCQQGASVLGTEYITETGYNGVAESNGIIVLYPQVHKSELSPINPRGCWDFWGYTSNNLPPYTYYQKDAPQMKAIKQMIERLQMPLGTELTPKVAVK